MDEIREVGLILSSQKGDHFKIDSPDTILTT